MFDVVQSFCSLSVSGNEEFLEARREMGMFMMKREREEQQMFVNLVSPLVPSLNILSVIILVQIINLSRRGCNKELLLKPSPLPAPSLPCFLYCLVITTNI